MHSVFAGHDPVSIVPISLVANKAGGAIPTRYRDIRWPSDDYTIDHFERSERVLIDDSRHEDIRHASTCSHGHNATHKKCAFLGEIVNAYEMFVGNVVDHLCGIG